MQQSHILSARQFAIRPLEDLFELADQMEERLIKKDIPPRNNPNGCALLFFQPSTRTHSSFYLAARYQDIPVWYSSQEAGVFSSAAKGESLEDTIGIFGNYPYIKVIVLRHPDNFSAQAAAEVADPLGVSIINAGDGTNEHPTQALLDLYTMRRHTHKNLQQVRLVVANDIEFSRTIRSLLILFINNYHPSEIGICAPLGINLPSDLQAELSREGVDIVVFRSLEIAAEWADFLYMTRPQIEYVARDIQDEEEKRRIIATRKKLFANFRLTRQHLDHLSSRSSCLIMHPMPIDRHDFNEIAKDASDHPRCIYYRQAANGLHIRMALLDQLIPNC